MEEAHTKSKIKRRFGCKKIRGWIRDGGSKTEVGLN
jgi:hypothetical protein